MPFGGGTRGAAGARPRRPRRPWRRALIAAPVCALFLAAPLGAQGPRQTANEAEAERLLDRGRAELARGPGHRFRALEAFRRAARLSPADPAPHYWIGRVGMELLGADGAAIARRGLERAIALDPDYADAWDLWLRLYRGPAERARMIDLLRPHAADRGVRARIAWLLVEGGACAAADSILDELSRELPDPRWAAWRADCAFQQGEDDRGLRLYAEAVAAAAADSSGALWAQVEEIARPAERERYRSAKPDELPAFFEAFWAYRDPDLFTAANERIAEHFRRRAQARERFHLRQPLALYHHSARYRRNVSALGADAQPELAELEPRVLLPGRNLPLQVDDRGLAFVRYGEPDHRDAFSLDAETWRFDGEPALELRFARVLGPAPMTDMIFRPPTRVGVDAVERVMSSDRSTYPAPLEFGFWLARFRAPADPNRTEIVLLVDSLAAVAALFDTAGAEVARARTEPGGILRLEAPPGEYLLGLDVARSDSLGRYRGQVVLPAFAGPAPALSDVVLAHGALHEGASRTDVLARAVASAAVPAAGAFTLYLEAYGLARDADGVSRYRVEYEWQERGAGLLARLRPGRRRGVVAYERATVVPAGEPVGHAVAIRPDGLPPGEYTLTVRIRDLIAGSAAVMGRRLRVRLSP